MYANPCETMTVRNALKEALGTTLTATFLLAVTPVAATATTLDETSIDFGGYIKMDAFYDFEGDQGATLLPSDVDVTGEPDEDANLGWTVKQTRLSISTTTPTAHGDIKGYIETDMYGSGFDSDDQAGSLRLRLAYIKYGNWLFGRNWTTFSNFNYGTFLNFAGPAGQVFQRTEQVRYTFDLGNDSNFAVALEEAAAADVTSASETVSSLPQLAMRYESSVGLLDVQVAGLVRSLKAENFVGAEDSTYGWGLNMGGTLALNSGTSLMLTGAYGEGIGDIIYTANFGPAAYFDRGSLETNTRYGVIATISQQWSDHLTTNAIYGYSQWQSGATDKEVTGTSLAVNLLYSPVQPLVFGIEYDRVTKQVRAGDSSNDGDANRIQFATIYYF